MPAPGSISAWYTWMITRSGCRRSCRGDSSSASPWRALINRPRVLLLDEPLSALDPFLRIKVREELKRLQRELGITFIHVTHSQDEAMALADLMVVMEHDHIRQAAHPRDVFERPASRPFIARFIGSHNVLRGTEGQIARAGGPLLVGLGAGRPACQWSGGGGGV